MPKSSKGHTFILCIIDEVTNYFNYNIDVSVESRRSRRSTHETLYYKILYSQLHNNGSR